MKKALVVDDEWFNRERARLYLETLNFEVTEASCGEEAVKIFNQTPEEFDVITMDYNMQGMDGVETIRIIREKNQTVLIIGISAAATVMQHRLGKISAISVLSKPLNKDKLEQLLKEAGV